MEEAEVVNVPAGRVSAADSIHAASERARRRLSLLGNLGVRGSKNRKAQRLNQSFGERTHHSCAAFIPPPPDPHWLFQLLRR